MLPLLPILWGIKKFLKHFIHLKVVSDVYYAAIQPFTKKGRSNGHSWKKKRLNCIFEQTFFFFAIPKGFKKQSHGVKIANCLNNWPSISNRYLTNSVLVKAKGQISYDHFSKILNKVSITSYPVKGVMEPEEILRLTWELVGRRFSMSPDSRVFERFRWW